MTLVNIVYVLLLTTLSPRSVVSGKRASIGINNGAPAPRSALGQHQRSRNISRSATVRDPKSGRVTQLPDFNEDGSIVMDPGSEDMVIPVETNTRQTPLARDSLRKQQAKELEQTSQELQPERMEEAGEPVIEIDYKNAGDGEIVIKSHELMLRHAPGIFGFASKCELDVAADHCAEVGMAEGDPFCTSGVIHTCRSLLPTCEEFESMPPCDKDRNECCKCAFQMCPLSRLGCKRVDRECYSEGATSKRTTPEGKVIEPSTRRAIQRVFNMLDLDGDTFLDRGELAMLLSAFSSAHTTQWDRLTHSKYLTVCSEVGASPKLGVSLKEVYKAFSRRRGVLYNMMLLAVKSVKSGRQTKLEKHQASVQTIFALCDNDGDGVLSKKEFLELTGGEESKAVRPGDRITVTRLKMLYLESHFRDLDEDLLRIRNKEFGGEGADVGVTRGQTLNAQLNPSGGQDTLITTLLVVITALVVLVAVLTFKLVANSASKKCD
eukprot:CAMPEP_0184483492 /NCGR_PEP_ID=MMETSP0113_2-20130426/5149_1 /TAXON_ID=91329 /ORGANISM="Norrisiella sphaerica, Strain BC52" /LENGTH=491 /DNA_ID=CAMNT_0026863933 /DNA_START=293 /DNA_END=1768 /DNA_ORIENTATION=+